MPNTHTTECISQAMLQDLLSERLDESSELRAQEHLGSCSRCQQALESAAGQPELWSDVAEQLDPAQRSEPAPERTGSDLEMLSALLDPSDDPEKMGRIGAYEVCGLVGRGTTGLVMKALEPRLGRFVAIKIMSPAYQSIGSARSRFEREARAVAAVSHEHVVPIHAVDDHRGLPYIVMKYIPGLSLEQRIERDGPLDTGQIARIGLQVAKGLAAAHDQGIVHRDVKPANVILEETVERAMVTDFGLARVVDEASMTTSGTISGTPQFMSPEQARGLSTSERSDLFSLGSLLYNAATGHAPFRAETVFGVIHRVCETEPRPIRETNPRIDDWLAALVGKLMEKCPEDRFPSAAETADALGAELAHLQNPTGTPLPPRNWMGQAAEGSGEPQHRRLARKLVPAGLLLAGAGLWGLMSTERGAELRASFAPKWALLWGQDIPVQETELETASTLPVYRKQLNQQLSLTAGQEVVLELVRGNVAVLPGTGGQLVLHTVREVQAADEEGAQALLSTVDFGITVGEGTLSIDDRASILHQPDPTGAQLESVSYSIELPPDHNLKVATSGDIVIGSVEGNVKARANRGSIEMVSGTTHGAELLAIGGNVTVAGASGGAWARTSNGNIYLGPSTGVVSAQTSGGDIHIDGMSGETAAHASSGSVYAVLAASPTELSMFSATDGDVEIQLAGDFPATFHARGTIESTFPFEEQISESTGSKFQSCSIGEGASPIQAQTSTGTLRISRVEASHATGGPSSSLDEEPMPEEPIASDDPTRGSGDTDEPDRGASSTGGFGGSGLGGSGLGSLYTPGLSPDAIARTLGDPRPGALATIEFDESIGNIDGYTLYLPESHAAYGGTYPILVYLQGAFGVGGEVADLNHWGLPRLLRDETDMTIPRNRLLLDGFIVLNLHITGGLYHQQPEVIGTILDSLIADFKGDPDRVSVTGLSAGGRGSWGLADAMPGRFAAIAPIGGRVDRIPDPEDLAGLSVWIAHNLNDRTVPIEVANGAAERIEELAGQSFLRLDPSDLESTDLSAQRLVFTSSTSGGHDAWTDVYTSEAFYTWLLAQSR